ncbi:uncharacterized protein LOC122391777 [Amphibalanus amphitrite]|uniref:uncharacterized protein LOC122391777 n=1 Tax=Amphibalanus amphitrite TaxID=1232801 RepID=UPI001C907472|nr:uncharacterized protein LOC122391777 [Amphibalanus amphitrite]
MGETKTGSRVMSTSGRSTAASAEVSSLSAAEGRLAPDSPATSSDTVELDERSGEMVQVTLGHPSGGAGIVYGPPPPTLSTFSAAAAAAAAAARSRPTSLERASKSRQQSLERRPGCSRSQSRQSHHSVSSQLYGAGGSQYGAQTHYEASYDPFDDPAVEVAIEPAGGFLMWP